MKPTASAAQLTILGKTLHESESICPRAEFVSAAECDESLRDAIERAQGLELQSEVGLHLLSDREPDDVLHSVLQLIAKAFRCRWSGLWVSSGISVYRLRSAWSTDEPAMHGFRLASRQFVGHSGKSLIGQAGNGTEPLYVDDYAAVAIERASAARRAGLGKWMGIPLIGNRESIGVIELFWDETGKPDPHRMAPLTVIARKVARYLERYQVSKALKDSERRYRLMFESNPCSMWVIDRERMKFLAVNQEALNLYGYGEGEFLALSGSDIRPPEDIPGYLDHMRMVRESGATTVHHRRERHVTSAGGLLDVDLTHYHVDWNGSHAELVMITNVTEQLAAERQRDEMEVQLRHAQKLEAIGQLAAGIAHEINTPSQYIGDNLRFLRTSFERIGTVLDCQEELTTAVETPTTTPVQLATFAEGVREAMKKVKFTYLRGEIPAAVEQSINGLTQVTSIVAAMKEFSHPSRKERTLADLNRALGTTVVVSRNEWKYCAEMETDFDPALPQVPCLVGELNQVFLNLIVNAAHAIQDRLADGEKGKITLRTKRSDDWVEVQVEDTGGGIPEHIQTRIFEPFFTTKDVGRGTGQGLAIARSIVVDKHGGTIHFTTRPGEGTTFIVRLPLLEPGT